LLLHNGMASVKKVRVCVYIYIYIKINTGQDVPIHVIKADGGVEVQLLPLIFSPLDEGEWSSSRPGCFTPGKHPRYN